MDFKSLQLLEIGMSTRRLSGARHEYINLLKCLEVIAQNFINKTKISILEKMRKIKQQNQEKKSNELNEMVTKDPRKEILVMNSICQELILIIEQTKNYAEQILDVIKTRIGLFKGRYYYIIDISKETLTKRIMTIVIYETISVKQQVLRLRDTYQSLFTNQDTVAQNEQNNQPKQNIDNFTHQQTHSKYFSIIDHLQKIFPFIDLSQQYQNVTLFSYNNMVYYHQPCYCNCSQQTIEQQKSETKKQKKIRKLKQQQEILKLNNFFEEVTEEHILQNINNLQNNDQYVIRINRKNRRQLLNNK